MGLSIRMKHFRPAFFIFFVTSMFFNENYRGKCRRIDCFEFHGQHVMNFVEMWTVSRARKTHKILEYWHTARWFSSLGVTHSTSSHVTRPIQETHFHPSTCHLLSRLSSSIYRLILFPLLILGIQRFYRYSEITHILRALLLFLPSPVLD